VGLVTAPFREFSIELLAQRNAGVLPLVTVGHPIGGIPPELARDLVTESVVAEIVAALTGGSAE
jgi:hypothetical protein